MNSFWLALIQLLIGGNLKTELGTSVAALVAANPQTSLAAVQAAINTNIATLVANLEKKVPGSSQALLAIALSLGQVALDSYVDSEVATLYQHEIQQLAGTAAGAAINAAATSSAALAETAAAATAPETVGTDGINLAGAIPVAAEEPATETVEPAANAQSPTPAA